MTLPGRADVPWQTRHRSLIATGLVRLTSRFQLPLGLAMAVCAILTTGSCVNAVSAVSDGSIPAELKVAELTDAFAARFTAPERSGHFETTRRQLASSALSPSRAYSDSSIWSAAGPGATKTLTAHGTLTDRGYRFEIASDPSALLKVGDTRHTITLQRLSDAEFRWFTGVDFAVGSLTAADAAGMLMELLAGGQEHNAGVIRGDIQSTFPRSSAVLARAFSIDSLTMHPSAQGTTTVKMIIGIRGDGLRATAPHFADYINKYVSSTRYRFSLTDRGGAMYFNAEGADQQVTVRYRVKAGALVSFLGPPRPLPDSARLGLDLTMRAKLFDFGWKNLAADFIIRSTEHSRTWLITARSEPDWQLPPITEQLLRSPLRRPFQGEGVTFEFGVVDSVGAQTLLVRHARLEVKESAILRFLGGLITRVFNDLDASVEREQAVYFRELVLAFQQDARVAFGK